jgi:hypothetical protein
MACQQYYVRSTRLVLPTLYDALGKGNDPDCMKGALYILWNKGIGKFGLMRLAHIVLNFLYFAAAYALTGGHLATLECALFTELESIRSGLAFQIPTFLARMSERGESERLATTFAVPLTRPFYSLQYRNLYPMSPMIASV